MLGKSGDWRQRVDIAWQRLAEEKRRRDQAEAERVSRRAKEEAEWRLIEHRRRFHCHICGMPSSGPEKRTGEEEYMNGSITVTWLDWDSSANLWRCVKCHRWACFEHYHNGYCQRCGERL